MLPLRQGQGKAGHQCHPQGPSGGLGAGDQGPDDGAPPCLSQARQHHRARLSRRPAKGGGGGGRRDQARGRSRGNLTPTRPLAGAPLGRPLRVRRSPGPASGAHGPRPVLAAAPPPALRTRLADIKAEAALPGPPRRKRLIGYNAALSRPRLPHAHTLPPQRPPRRPNSTLLPPPSHTSLLLSCGCNEWRLNLADENEIEVVQGRGNPQVFERNRIARLPVANDGNVSLRLDLQACEGGRLRRGSWQIDARPSGAPPALRPAGQVPVKGKRRRAPREFPDEYGHTLRIIRENRPREPAP